MNMTTEDIINHIQSLIKEEENVIFTFGDKEQNILTNMCISISKYKIDVLSSLLKDIEGGSISSTATVNTEIDLEPNDDMKNWTDEKPYTLVNNESGELYSFPQLGEENRKSFSFDELLSITSTMHSPKDYHVNYKNTTMKIGDNYLNAQEWKEKYNK